MPALIPSRVLTALADEAGRLGRDAWLESDACLERAERWLARERELRQLAADQAAAEQAEGFVGKNVVAIRGRA